MHTEHIVPDTVHYNCPISDDYITLQLTNPPPQTQGEENSKVPLRKIKYV